MNREDILDKILRNESLTDLEQAWWSAHKADSENLDALHFLHEMEEPLRLENRRLLKTQLQDIEEHASSKKSLGAKRVIMASPSTRKWLMVAAAALLLCTAIVFYFQNQNNDLFVESFEPYPSIINPVLKGEMANGNAASEAMTAYQNKNYQQALAYFAESGTLSDTLLFYKANALLALQRNQEALSIFKNIGSHENRFKREAAWYQAIALLGPKSNDEAILLLTRIKDDNEHPFQEEAESLLDRLK